jgi:hypothetical protein
VIKANTHAGRDTIELAAGRKYELTQPRPDDSDDSDATVGDLDVTDPLILRSSGPKTATIDANGIDRVIYAEAVSLTLDRIKATGGSFGDFFANGAVLAREGPMPTKVTIKRSLITKNQDTGFSADSSTVSIIGSKFTHNSTPYVGAGITVGGLAVGRLSKVRIDRSLIAHNEQTGLENYVFGGGGLFSDLADLRITRSRFFDNHATGTGGAFFTNDGQSSSGAVKVSNSTFSGNSGGDSSQSLKGGGAISNINSDLTIKTSTFDDNEAVSSGGAIMNIGSDAEVAELVLADSTIAGNRATDFGGGIDSFTQNGGIANVSLNGVTVAFNDADSDNTGPGQGGGLQSGTGSGTFSVKNSVIASNTGAVGVDCAGFAFASGSNNVIGSAADCFGFTPPGDLLNLDAKLKPLANNGGPTQTIALSKSSPAVGHGGPTTPKRDQRGVKRDSHPDSGAYER